MGKCLETLTLSRGAPGLRQTQVVISGVAVHREQLETLCLSAGA